MQPDNPFASLLAESRRKRWRITATATLALMISYFVGNTVFGFAATYWSGRGIDGVILHSAVATIAHWFSGIMTLILGLVAGLLIYKKLFKVATAVNVVGLFFLLVAHCLIVFYIITTKHVS